MDLPNLLKRNPDPTPQEWGPAAWADFEETVSIIPCASCKAHGRKALQAVRDMIAVNNGKRPYDAANLVEFSKILNKIVEECHHKGFCSPKSGLRLTACERRHPSVVARLERCIQDVKEKGGARNPYAVCRASVRCPPRVYVAGP